MKQVPCPKCKISPHAKRMSHAMTEASVRVAWPSVRENLTKCLWTPDTVCVGFCSAQADNPILFIPIKSENSSALNVEYLLKILA